MQTEPISSNITHSNMEHPKWFAWVAFAVVCMAWGSIYLLVASLLDHFNPLVISFLRSFVAFVLIAGWNMYQYYSTKSVAPSEAAMTDYASLQYAMLYYVLACNLQ